VRMVSTAASYIPLGCITISEHNGNLSHEEWLMDELQEWASIVSKDERDQPLYPDKDLLPLPLSIQTRVLKAAGLYSSLHLVARRWLKIQFKVVPSPSNLGIFRISALAEDRERGSIERSDGSLKKIQKALLRRLNFSKALWNGRPNGSHWPSPMPFRQPTETPDEDLSLLQMFNNIPSPEPNPDIVTDVTIQESMFWLLESKVPGLTTELYSYQRNSAALMLQREAAPGSVLDPRLTHVVDHDGHGFFYDGHAGTILREPLYYDGVAGGILAEQMGAGKTIICLALILATKHLPSKIPDFYAGGDVATRKKVGSLADMAAACATRQSVAWKLYFEVAQTQAGYEFTKCLDAIKRNPGHYYLPTPAAKRATRRPSLFTVRPPKKVYLSQSSLIIVPNNLVHQWNQEILKHTTGLSVLTITTKEYIPPARKLLQYDIILLSQSRFEQVRGEPGGMDRCPLSEIHFKRCIVDEGHRLGNSRIGYKSNLLLGLESIQISSRWIVTGTPSQGLYGVDDHSSAEGTPEADATASMAARRREDAASEQEKKDLERIGSIASLYLMARPWANTIREPGDTPAQWSLYVMQPRHGSKSSSRGDCLRSTLNSLIIRHRLSEISDLLPPVDEKVTILDGSYQDKLSLNIFTMMIIFNSVLSQRTDVDYFFHARQRKNLLLLVHNLKQASFFGGSFFTAEEIAKSVETAEKFLEDRKVPVTLEDEALLKEAIALGHTALGNPLRNSSNRFHEMPVYISGFPGGAGKAWSLDDEDGDLICTDASLLLALQRLIRPCMDNPESLNNLLNGRLYEAGRAEIMNALSPPESRPSTTGGDQSSKVLAGNTRLGDDSSPRKLKLNALSTSLSAKERVADEASHAVADPLKQTQIVSTVSAKMSYLIDSIMKYHAEEQIIIFYENDNIAWYLASLLDVVRGPYSFLIVLTCSLVDIASNSELNLRKRLDNRAT
jgi:hypothetical protein